MNGKMQAGKTVLMRLIGTLKKIERRRKIKKRIRPSFLDSADNPTKSDASHRCFIFFSL
jgi:hypothetical protein